MTKKKNPPREDVVCSNCGKPFDEKDAVQNACIHFPITEGKYKGCVFNAHYCIDCMDNFIEILCGTQRTDPITGENNHAFATWEEDHV